MKENNTLMKARLGKVDYTIKKTKDRYGITEV